MTHKNSGSQFKPGNPHRFKPGHSGNPGGKLSAQRAVTLQVVKDQLGAVHPKLGTTALERIVAHTIRCALQGSYKDKKLLSSYGLGMPTQLLEHAGGIDLTGIVREARQRAEADLPALPAPTNAYGATQPAQAATTEAPEQDLGREDGAAGQPAKPKVKVDLWNCSITGAWTYTTQIVSTVATGTAPFSIASTTVTPNLNAQLHNGKTAPAGNIVGDTDTQTLTNKTLTGASSGISITSLNAQANGSAVTGTGSAVVLYTYTLPGNTVANLKGFRINVGWIHSTGSAVVTYNLQLNGVNIAHIANSAFSGKGAWVSATVLNTGSTTASSSGFPPLSASLLRGGPMTEERKYAILFSATILAARKLAEIGDRPCPAREMCMEDAIRNAERILQKIDERWPTEASA